MGTGGMPKDRTAWTHRDSDFSRFLRTHGVEPARPERPFDWKGGLDGIPFIGGNDWEAAMESFVYYTEDFPYDDRNVIAHSHSGQFVLMAAADGLQLRSLVMVGTPVRRDIERYIAPLAVRNIGHVLHISDASWDWWGLAGALFDRRLSFRRHFNVPGIATDRVTGIGHAGILRDEQLFDLWTQRGWLKVLRGVVQEART
jgi:hypothetical protein